MSHDTFIFKGQPWLRTQIPYAVDGRHFTVSIPKAFEEHISVDSSDYAGAILSTILSAVSDGRDGECSPLGTLPEAHDLMSQWCGFDARERWGLRKKTLTNLHTPAASARVGLLFSAGVDSTFTLTWLRQHVSGKIVALSLIHSSDGAPEPVQTALFEDMRSSLAKHDVDLLYAATNVMTCNDRIADLWAFATHGACIAAIGHLLSAKVDRYFLSSSHDYSWVHPWGSHPLLDPLFSSENLLISHFGTEFSRYEKVAFIAEKKLGLSALSVCGHGPRAGRYYNCSKCQKCLRTMVALDACGVKEEATSFDWSQYSPQSLRKLRLEGESELAFAHQTMRATRETRPDISDSLQEAIDRSWLRPILQSVETRIRLKFMIDGRTKKVLLPVKRRFLSALSPIA